MSSFLLFLILLKTDIICSSDFWILCDISCSSIDSNSSSYLVITILLLPFSVWARIQSVSDLTLSVPIGGKSVQFLLIERNSTQVFIPTRSHSFNLTVSLNLRVVPDDMTSISLDDIVYIYIYISCHQFRILFHRYRRSPDCPLTAIHVSPLLRKILRSFIDIVSCMGTLVWNIWDSDISWQFSVTACPCVILLILTLGRDVCYCLFVCYRLLPPASWMTLKICVDISYPFSLLVRSLMVLIWCLSACFRFLLNFKGVTDAWCVFRKWCIDIFVSLSSAFPVSQGSAFWFFWFLYSMITCLTWSVDSSS